MNGPRLAELERLGLPLKDHRLLQQSHHVDLLSQQKLSDLRCHDRQHELDTKGNQLPVCGRYAELELLLSPQVGNDALSFHTILLS